jgi:hypothetical protein
MEMGIKDRVFAVWNRYWCNELDSAERKSIRSHRESLLLQRDCLDKKIKDLESTIASSCSLGIIVPDNTCEALWKARHMRRELDLLISSFGRAVGSTGNVETKGKGDDVVQTAMHASR